MCKNVPFYIPDSVTDYYLALPHYNADLHDENSIFDFIERAMEHLVHYTFASDELTNEEYCFECVLNDHFATLYIDDLTIHRTPVTYDRGDGWIIPPTYDGGEAYDYYMKGLHLIVEGDNTDDPPIFSGSLPDFW